MQSPSLQVHIVCGMHVRQHMDPDSIWPGLAVWVATNWPSDLNLNFKKNDQLRNNRPPELLEGTAVITGAGSRVTYTSTSCGLSRRHGSPTRKGPGLDQCEKLQEAYLQVGCKYSCEAWCSSVTEIEDDCDGCAIANAEALQTAVSVL